VACWASPESHRAVSVSASAQALPGWLSTRWPGARMSRPFAYRPSREHLGWALETFNLILSGPLQDYIHFKSIWRWVGLESFHLWLPVCCWTGNFKWWKPLTWHFNRAITFSRLGKMLRFFLLYYDIQPCCLNI